VILLVWALVVSGCGGGPGPPGPPAGGAEARPLAGLASKDLVQELALGRDRPEAAREIGRRRLHDDVPFLRKYTKDDDAAVRAACVWALGEIGDQESAMGLRWRLDDDVPHVRAAACQALARLPPEEPNLKGILKVLPDSSAEVRLAAVQALGTMADDARAVRGLVTALSDEEPAVYRAAMKELLRVGKPAVSALGDAAPCDPPHHRDGRGEAACVLAGIGGPETAPALVTLLVRVCGRGPLPEASRPARQAILDALVALGEPAIRELDRQVVQKSGGDLLPAKHAAAEVFVRLGKPAVPAVARRILAWQVFPSREELLLWIRTLGRIGDPEAVPALRHAEPQMGAGIKEAVAEALRQIEAKSK
jgi:HEAT repeat protein